MSKVQLSEESVSLLSDEMAPGDMMMMAASPASFAGGASPLPRSAWAAATGVCVGGGRRGLGGAGAGGAGGGVAILVGVGQRAG